MENINLKYYNSNSNHLKRKAENGTKSDTSMKIQKKSDEVLEELNSIQSKKLISIKDLEMNEEYSILSAKKVKTKYGEQIMVELMENVTFLPKRYQSLSEKTINGLNNGNYSMKITGILGKTFKIEFMLSTEANDAFTNIDDDDDYYIAATQEPVSYI